MSHEIDIKILGGLPVSIRFSDLEDWDIVAVNGKYIKTDSKFVHALHKRLVQTGEYLDIENMLEEYV